MSKTVGIPRGLFFYRFYPLWKSFFDKLGVNTVVSDASNKRIMDKGVSSCINEACLPVKLFHAHVLELRDKVDYIFVPKFTSLSKNEYICPKFGGIPDMVRNAFEGLPTIIDVEINMIKSQKGAKTAAYKTGSYFTDNKNRMRQAYSKAVESHKAYRQKFLSGLLLEDIVGDKWNKPANNGLKILLLGHSYNVYDSYLNMDIINKIRNLGGDVLTLEMLESDTSRKHTGKLQKPIFWEYGSKALGCAYEVINRANIDGIIYLTCFGCGIDSFVCNMVQRRIKNASGIPFITITLDEQSGQAGLNTRIEAFMDTLKWRKNGNNISTYGQRSCLC